MTRRLALFRWISVRLTNRYSRGAAITLDDGTVVLVGGPSSVIESQLDTLGIPHMDGRRSLILKPNASTWVTGPVLGVPRCVKRELNDASSRSNDSSPVQQGL